MKRCYELLDTTKESFCKENCNGVRVLAAIDFYNSNPKIGDKVLTREHKDTDTIDYFSENGGVGTKEKLMGIYPPCNLIVVEQKK